MFILCSKLSIFLIILVFYLYIFFNFIPDTLSDGSSVNSYNLSGLPSQDEIDGLAAVYQLRDIDSFIEKITVPPPPERSSHQWNAEMMTTEALDDISAFIIPPPPAKNDVNEELNINNETTKIVSPDLSRVSASSAASIGKKKTLIFWPNFEKSSF